MGLPGSGSCDTGRVSEDLYYTFRVNPRGWADGEEGPDGPMSRDEALSRRTEPDPVGGWRTIAVRAVEDEP